MRRLLLTLTFLLTALFPLQAQQGVRNPLRETAPEFFTTDEARRIGDQVLLYQRVTGGWPKNIDMAHPLTDEERAKVEADKQREDDSTTDNNATTTQMYYLARLYQATGDSRYSEAFRRAVSYLLSGQYESGGWPQFWPKMRDYQIHITFNDNAMVNTMELLRAIAQERAPFGNSLTDASTRQRAIQAFDKGVECILRTQIRLADGQLTVWCQQHDRETFQPAPARAYELPSFSSQESAAIVRLLMSLPSPDERVKASVHAAMAWFDKYKLTGLRIKRTGMKGSPDANVELVPDAQAKPIWGRYYDLKYCEPYVCDRDGLPRRRLEDIGVERRTGYSWYNSEAAKLYPLYDEWADRVDPAHKVNISLDTKGANENGLMDLSRQPRKDLSLFDAVVLPGQRIQDAIERAPQTPDKPYKILIRNGVYEQKVIVDRPNIVLVGEHRDSTILRLAETAQTRAIKEYHGKPVHNGVVVIMPGADDCVISGLTVYNNYGTAVDPGNTTHQMAVYGEATRTIILNSNIWADGNDALSLWAPKSGGMYYHADLYLRCLGVDFLCPRGWCYATRCRFEGDGHAILWHDGRGDASKKLVITNSTFDAKSPTPLGRYHHDAHFYLINCKLSAQILDQNIRHAYYGRTAEEMKKEGKVLDPCPWGQRVYYYGTHREGGDSGWLADNLDQAPGSPKFYGITARWAFDEQWNPEQQIRDLWPVLAY